MRDIKFRAVYEPDKETPSGALMFYQRMVGYVLCFCHDIDNDTPIQYEFNVPFINDDWTLMQYTGIKDKNGTEIYEGDIVKGEATPDFDPDHIAFTGEVKWDLEDTGFYYETNTNWPCIKPWFSDPTKLVKIGNIHENPEMI